MIDHLLFALIAACATAGAVVAGAAALRGAPRRERRIQALGGGEPQALPVRVSRWETGRLLAALARTLHLRDWIRLEDMRLRLARAGQRSAADEAIFLAAHIVCPLLLGGLTALSVFVFHVPAVSPIAQFALVALAGYLGVKLPNILLSRRIKRRQTAMRRAWPEALDLMLIHVEAGRSADQAFRRVSEDMAPRSRDLAVELAITLVELQFLERRQAYENFSARTELDEVRGTCTALLQSHEQGSALGETFRILARESREVRLHAAERKAAEVTAMLPVPVLVFFLIPIIVIAILPVLIDYMNWK